MKRKKILHGMIALAAILIISPVTANATPGDDTLRVVVEGDTVSTVNLNELDNMDDMPNMDSIMDIVNEAMKEVDEAMEDIRIEDHGKTKNVIITDKDGDVIKNMKVKSTGNKEGDSEFEFEFEKDDSEKNFYNFMVCETGMNNYLENEAFPGGDELYYVKPFGSWSFTLGSGFRAYAANWFSVDISADILWYNFKLQNKAVVTDEGMVDDDKMIVYQENPEYNEGANNAIRSKLTVTYLNMDVMPVFHIGPEKSGINKRLLRIGTGAYAGYRLGAHTKNVWDESGQKRKEKNYDNFYLSNIRYGVKAMIGVKDFNLFMNYDLNSLFEKDKGPDGKELNAFAFGVRFII
ncbi:MAG: hypothetical protein R6V32_12150 [Bacteroidales bacterium]